MLYGEIYLPLADTVSLPLGTFTNLFGHVAMILILVAGCTIIAIRQHRAERSPARKPRRRPLRFGFRELLAAGIIVALATAAFIAWMPGRIEQARARLARIQVEEIRDGLARLAADTGRLPSQQTVWRELSADTSDVPGWQGNYVHKTSLGLHLFDPWKHAFVYRVPADTGRPFAVVSLGADGAPGGEGAAADIVAD